MARWIAFLFLVSLLIIFSDSAVPGSAQSMQTAQATSGAPLVVTPGEIVPPVSETPVSSLQLRTLILTAQDNGQTFTIPVNTLILVQIPRSPYSRLDYDPSILRLLPIYPRPVEPQPYEGQPSNQTPIPPNIAYPIGGWRLIAIRPGITELVLAQEPCLQQPCPMMPIFNFRVTIIVRGYATPFPPPPPVRSIRADKYIGTAYLNQTVTVQVGDVVTLDLPSLTGQQAVQLQFNSSILQPLPGQNLSAPQPGGWHFQVIGSGTTTLTVRGSGCIDCQSTLLFQVTITTLAS